MLFELQSYVTEIFCKSLELDSLSARGKKLELITCLYVEKEAEINNVYGHI